VLRYTVARGEAAADRVKQINDSGELFGGILQGDRGVVAHHRQLIGPQRWKLSQGIRPPDDPHMTVLIF
jgi:hypothetical protein